MQDNQYVITVRIHSTVCIHITVQIHITVCIHITVNIHRVCMMLSGS